MVVTIIGSDDYKRSAMSVIKLWEVLGNVVVDGGEHVFLFTNEGLFDFICWQIVAQLNISKLNIKLICVQTGYEDNKDGRQWSDRHYDKILLANYLCKNRVTAPYVRSRLMIGMSDVLVTYLDTGSLQSPRIESVTESAIKFAKRYKKRVINVFDRKMLREETY